MAVTVSGKNPLVVTGTTSTKDVVKDNEYSHVYVTRVYWDRPTTAGHKFSLVDRFNNTIVAIEADADGANQEREIGVGYEGVYCNDMDSGTAYIYIQ